MADMVYCLCSSSRRVPDVTPLANLSHKLDCMYRYRHINTFNNKWEALSLKQGGPQLECMSATTGLSPNLCSRAPLA